MVALLAFWLKLLSEFLRGQNRKVRGDNIGMYVIFSHKRNLLKTRRQRWELKTVSCNTTHVLYRFTPSLPPLPSLPRTPRCPQPPQHPSLPTPFPVPLSAHTLTSTAPCPNPSLLYISVARVSAHQGAIKNSSVPLTAPCSHGLVVPRWLAVTWWWLTPEPRHEG